MVDRLVRNMVVTGAAFAGGSLVNLVLIPVLVRTYGLGSFGLLVLARVLLPTGFLAILDFGFPELSTETVARARVSRAWNQAGTRIGRMLFLALVVGAGAGMVLWTLRDVLLKVFRVDPVNQDAYGLLITATAAALIVFFPSQVFEGVIKGFERYAIVRTLEIASNLVYAAATLWLVWNGAPFHYVGFAFLAANALRYSVSALVAVRLLRDAGAPLRWASERDGDLARRAWLMFQGKALGAVQGQALPLVIGVLVSSAGVGVYDVLTRLPRFLKVVFGTLNGPLLPVSARLEEAGNREGSQRLIGAGLTLVPATTIPIFAGGALFSEEILRIWVGPGLEHVWGWLSALFIATVLITIVGFGQTTLLVRPTALRVLNLSLLGQLVLMLVLGVSLVGWLAERAFILSQIVAVAVTFPIQAVIIAREQRVVLSSVGRFYAKMVLAGLPVAAVVLYVFRVQIPIDGFLCLGVALGIFAILYWLTLYVFTFTPVDRNIVRRVVVSSAVYAMRIRQV